MADSWIIQPSAVHAGGFLGWAPFVGDVARFDPLGSLQICVADVVLQVNRDKRWKARQSPMPTGFFLILFHSLSRLSDDGGTEVTYRPLCHVAALPPNNPYGQALPEIG
jgi:hypothetical protein